MTAKKPAKPQDKESGPTQALQQQVEAAAPAPLEIAHKDSRPRLSGEGAEAALQHLIEREKNRIDDRKLT